MGNVAAPVRRLASSAAGLALAGATRAVAAVRTAGKPLHPRGRVVMGRLRRTGAEPPTGVAWLDETGDDEVLVRWSRAVGLPSPLPDIHGLALRVPRDDGGHGDLLFATTGLGRLTRFVLTASGTPYGRPLTTLLPYRTAHGPLLLAAVGTGEGRFEIACASPSGPWRHVAHLDLSDTEGPDPEISFDPVRNTVPGLAAYDLVRRLREPSYRTARRTRRD